MTRLDEGTSRGAHSLTCDGGGLRGRGTASDSGDSEALAVFAKDGTVNFVIGDFIARPI